MCVTPSDIVITVDSHLGESQALRDRLPKELRDNFSVYQSIDDLMRQASRNRRSHRSGCHRSHRSPCRATRLTHASARTSNPKRAFPPICLATL